MNAAAKDTVGAFTKAKERLAKVFETSSKTKLLMALGIIALAEAAPITASERIKWQALAGIAFIVGQSIKEAFATKK